VIGYACAWLAGCNDDLAGMARAAYLWKNGECYCWDEVQENWFPTSCPPPDSGYCAAASPPQALSGQVALARVVASATAKTSVRSIRSRRVGTTQEVKMPITIEAPEGTSVMALEIEVPSGWKVVDISDAGQWDEAHRKVKWGLFFDDLSRTVTFTARRSVDKVSTKLRRLTDEAGVVGFLGRVSFDGVNHPITVR
jgi:hypothetical protein